MCNFLHTVPLFHHGFNEAYFFAAFFAGACVNAEAAADLAALLALGSSNTFAAFEATEALVTFVVLVCAKADAATDFSSLLAVLLASTLEALDAGFLPVDSDFAMFLKSLIQRRVLHFTAS